jgi:toxin ParE2
VAGNRIEIHPAAFSKLKSAVEWYLEQSEPAAHEFGAEVDRAIALVIDSPTRWPVGEHKTSRFVYAAVSFRNHLPRKDSGVQILAFAHGHRRPGYWRERL